MQCMNLRRHHVIGTAEKKGSGDHIIEIVNT